MRASDACILFSMSSDANRKLHEELLAPRVAVPAPANTERERTPLRSRCQGLAVSSTLTRSALADLVTMVHAEVLELTAALTERTAALDRAYREREDAVLRCDDGSGVH